MAVRYLQALVDRDAQTLYGLLEPETRNRITELHLRLKRTRDLIEEHYPEEARREAIGATNVDILDTAASPQALFESFVARAGETATLSRLQKLGLRIKSVESSGSEAIVTTLGGDSVKVTEIEGAWFVVLDLEDTTRLQQLETEAERNLGRVRQEVNALRKHRFGGAQGK